MPGTIRGVRVLGIAGLVLGVVALAQGLAWLGRPGPALAGGRLPRAVAGTVAALAGVGLLFAGLWYALV